MIRELKYGNTNTYLIKESGKYILFDTDWAGTFNLFCKALKKANVKLEDIEYLFISHFHPDHMGLAGQLAEMGIKIVVLDIQKGFLHCSDGIFAKDKRKTFVPIDDTKVIPIGIEESRVFLKKTGIEGEILHTPGHSEDSISIWLDDGSLLVGDLNPLYELPMHEGTRIGAVWNQLLMRKPQKVYYGHAKLAILKNGQFIEPEKALDGEERHRLVSAIMKYADKNYSLDKIQKKTGADRTFVDDVLRMYFTHQNVSVQGILDRIEIKNK